MNFNVVRNYIQNFEINLSRKQTITILSFNFCNSFSKDCFCDLFSNLSSFNCFNRNRLIWLTPGQSLKRRCVPWVRIVTCNEVNHIVQHMYRRVWYQYGTCTRARSQWEGCIQSKSTWLMFIYLFLLRR